MKKIFITLILVSCYGLTSFAQAPDYIYMSHQDSSDFYAIRNITQSYFDSTGLDTVQGSGYKQFKRWESFWQNRVGNEYNHGSFQPSIESFAQFAMATNKCAGGTNGDQWQFIGHTNEGLPQNCNGNPCWGAGQGIAVKVHVDLVHDATGNTIYIGSHTGGLWRTRNAKTTNPTWVCLTDQGFPGMGVNDIAIDPSNSNIIYISTGLDVNAGLKYGMGILKTTNGQSNNPTWTTTGLSFDLGNPSDIVFTQGVFISPSSNSTIFALKKNEVWRSTNSGSTFSKILEISGGKHLLRDLVFLPNSASTIFISADDVLKDDGGAVVFKSTDNGDNWTNITSSLGFSELKERIDLAVTDANTTFVLAAGGSIGHNTYSNNYEVSKSTNSGSTWSKTNASFSGSLGGFKVGNAMNDIIISPDDEDIIYLAGTQLSKSTNGGANFTVLYNYWGAIVHPDVRDLDIIKDGQGNDWIYSANDGGLSISENGGSTWKNLNGTGLNITQIYGFDVNLKKDWIAIGTQDLGFYNYDNGTWVNHTHGDGVRMIFNPFEGTETMYGQTNNNGLLYSNNRGASWGNFLSNSGITGNWERKLAFDGVGNLYVGFNKKLYRKNAGTNTFVEVGHFPNAIHRIWGIGVSKSDPNVIYVGFDEPTWSGGSPSNRLYKTSNALASTPTWTDISANIPVNWMGISDIIVDSHNPDLVWVATGTRFAESGVTTADRVHYSSNGGSSFVAINQGLNYNSTSTLRFPVNVMVLDETTGGMYIGTDIGVYYNPNPKNASSSWQCFNKDLPAAIVTDLKIDYCSRKILASTYGRGLWESPLATGSQTIDYVVTSTAMLDIETNETWLFYSDITIPTGQIFTVKGKVMMAPNRKITIQAGAKLLIDGGIITSTCDLPWLGIFIEGNTHLSQHSSASNQGFVEMKNNAIIENAVEAIFVSGLKPNGEIDWSKCGGIIRATNSTFRNNRRDVAFLSYHHYNPSGVEIINYSYFRNCQFLTTDDNKFPSNLLGIHVTMWDVNGVRFQGCTFEDQRSNIVAKTQGRKGICTIQSTFEVTKNCPFMTSCTAPSKFINLKSAIESFSNGSRGQISIEFSEFDSYKGIYLQGINSASVRANEFTIGHDVLVSGNTDYPYGLYLDQCQNFNTEGNTFNGTTGAANVANGGAAGLVIRNTGANNNNFYRSNFNNMKLASQALSENRETGLDKGLRFRCNYYDENYNDLDVRNDPNNPYSIFGQLGMAELHGIVQGGSPLTPNNQFGNFSSILNYNIENRGNWMQYVYHGTPSQSNLTYPWITTSNVSTFIAGAASTCPDLINNFGVDKGPFKVNLDGIRPLMVVKAQDWDIVTDGGNSQNMKQAILTANGGNIGAVYLDLITASPYLSNDVLALVAEQDAPFTQEMILNIMLANPHSSRSYWVQNNLDNRNSPLPTNYRDSINGLVEVYTHRDTLGAELSALSEEHDLILSELLYSYMTDSLFSIDSISPYLLHPTNPTYHYQLAELYFDNGNYEAYESVTDSIPLKFNLNESQENYHSAFTGLYSQLQSWHGDSVNLFEKDSSRLVWLLNYTNTHSVYPSRVHALLAANDTFIITPNVIIDFEEEEPMIPDFNTTIEQIIAENAKSDILLFPNPANTEISLKWKDGFKSSVVKIYDMNGRLVHQQNWNESQQLTVNVSGWPSGIYFINVNAGSSENINRKLIINR